MVKLKFSARVKKIGTGFYILVPATIRNEGKIKEKEFLEVEICKEQRTFKVTAGDKQR